MYHELQCRINSNIYLKMNVYIFRRGYFRVDDTDPFLPGPPPYSGYGSMSGELGSSRHERVSILSSTHGSTHGSVHGSIHGSTHGSMHEGSVHSLR